MARPMRAAAQRALDLIAAGLAPKMIDSEEEEGMSSGEEEELDEELCRDFGEISVSEEEYDSEVDPNEGAAVSRPLPGNVDQEPDVPEFRPENPVGPQLEEPLRTGPKKMYRAIDFFKLFFTREIMDIILQNTNKYAWMMILSKQSYACADGSWDEVTTEELYAFIGLLIMKGFIKISDIGRQWSQATLYSGGWSCRFLGRNRYKALAAMVHVSDPSDEDANDKLTKVRLLIEHLKQKYSQVYQPKINISVDERMVRSKARSGICQYIPNKPVRFGFKVWCMCEADSGYTLDFDVYTGRRQKPSKNGLGFDVVSSLVARYAGQGYRFFFDNFFTSMILLKHLAANGLGACGTTLPCRRGYPDELKDKQWLKKAKTGESRYVWKEGVLCLQWQDKKPVCVCSNLHNAQESVMVRRHRKRPDGSHAVVMLHKPSAVNDYNSYMGGVDLSDQLLTPYSMLHKSRRWWRTIFYHLIDMTILNSYLLFRKWQELHPDVPELQRPNDYSHLAFREELSRQLAGIRDDEDPPMSAHKPRSMRFFAMADVHIPLYRADRKNCRVCSFMQGNAVRTHWYCSHDDCNVPICLNKDRNCFKLWHTDEYQSLRCSMLK